VLNTIAKSFPRVFRMRVSAGSELPAGAPARVSSHSGPRPGLTELRAGTVTVMILG
jgi:hypothetical protein